jgi:hypothetical protein
LCTAGGDFYDLTGSRIRYIQIPRAVKGEILGDGKISNGVDDGSRSIKFVNFPTHNYKHVPDRVKGYRAGLTQSGSKGGRGRSRASASRPFINISAELVPFKQIPRTVKGQARWVVQAGGECCMCSSRIFQEAFTAIVSHEQVLRVSCKSCQEQAANRSSDCYRCIYSFHCIIGVTESFLLF